MPKWQFWVDRGGTFTDLIARTPQGQLLTAKLLSDNPQQYDDAVLQGICDLMQVPCIDDIPSNQIDCIRLGTTVATNALLERKGAPTLLVTTKGFGDALKIGYQNRPELFALHIKLPEPLYEEVIEVDERLAADGSVVSALNASAYEDTFRAALDRGLESVAVVFMHSYCNPAHELAIGELAKKVGFKQVSLSHQVSALIKFVGRGDTAVVDAYVSPVLQGYVRSLSEKLPKTRLLFMQSSGGLTDGVKFRGCNSLLSGPAGGVIGGVKASQADGYNKVLGFDMGGTSTDVWHFDGGEDQNGDSDYEQVYETTVAGVRLRVPMLDIHTVAAGGGSICFFDGSKLRVGPESAGANPGPACYGFGGPLTITDCNLLLGKLKADYFPQVFGESGGESINTAVAESSAREIIRQMVQAGIDELPLEALAEGFIDIAVEGMAGAIKKVSTERGHDVSQYVLSCFGGAAGQHACRVAASLGVDTVFIHPLAGVLSALGMGLAEISSQVEQSLEWPLDEDDLGLDLSQVIAEMRDKAAHQLISRSDAGVVGNQEPRDNIVWREKVFLRYQGSNTMIDVAVDTSEAMKGAFEQAHVAKFSFMQEDRVVVIDSLSVEAVVSNTTDTDEYIVSTLDPVSAVLDAKTPDEGLTGTQTPIYTDARQRLAPILMRTSLSAGQTITGPALIIDDAATTMVEPGWQALVLDSGSLRLTRLLNESPQNEGKSRQMSTARDPIQLEIFNYRFMSIAEQMGAVLANTAHSVNIKERLDFSCAIFDGAGQLVANAPHVPVHLGSMGETVMQIIAARMGTFVDGDAYLVNSPYAGGTHLPDLTVVTPVFAAELPGELSPEKLSSQKTAGPAFFVATRAHHADIGGTTPGSIPPNSVSIIEEGVLFENFHLVKDGVLQTESLISCLAAGDYPARNIDQNIADLQAQIAANVLGQRALERLVAGSGYGVVTAYMAYVQDNAEEAVRRVISSLSDGQFTYAMDNGALIKVALHVDKQKNRLTVDFTGTSAQQNNNFNAPSAVCKAAVLYVLRTLVADNIPLNAGCLKPVDIVIPEGCLLNPRYPAAVVAGNVETSQYIADALYGALGVLAGSQGTMNNVTFGDESFQYYETVCGGAGAGDGFMGASAVQVHMTNSRLTDPEILEQRFPVRLESFSIRRGSGGTGAYPGGDGVVRQIKFLQSMACNLVSSHREVGAFGLEGGNEGQKGRNCLHRASGENLELSGVASFTVDSGDLLTVETPGGGAYGANYTGLTNSGSKER